MGGLSRPKDGCETPVCHSRRLHALDSFGCVTIGNRGDKWRCALTTWNISNGQVIGVDLTGREEAKRDCPRPQRRYRTTVVAVTEPRQKKHKMSVRCVFARCFGLSPSGDKERANRQGRTSSPFQTSRPLGSLFGTTREHVAIHTVPDIPIGKVT